MVDGLLTAFLTLCMSIGVYDVAVWVHKKLSKK